jgi:hypothetical protein
MFELGGDLLLPGGFIDLVVGGLADQFVHLAVDFNE